MKQKRDQVRCFASEEIAAGRDVPLVDAVAEDWASGCMLVLTSLALELSRKFFGRDLDDACLLIRGTIAVVAVINHFEKVIELVIIIEHAKSKDLI